MQELTSSYDDLEKRMAVYLGLGAMLFSSFYLFATGADLWTFLIRGVLSLAVFTIIGWGYGHWLRELYRKNSSEEPLPDNVERQSRDAHAVEGRVITHAEMPEMVIPGEAAEAPGPELRDFKMPDFDSPTIPARAAAPATITGDDDDLPPPAVPAGA